MKKLLNLKHYDHYEKSKTFSRKLTAVVMAGVMGVSMVAPVVAAPGDQTVVETRLYKNDKFDPSNLDENKSMGDGAVKHTTYTEVSEGVYGVNIEFESSFTAYLVTGYLSSLKIDVDGDGTYNEIEGQDYFIIRGGENNRAVVGCSFTTDEIPTTAKKYNAQFTIGIGGTNMPANSEGDLYILPGQPLTPAPSNN